MIVKTYTSTSPKNYLNKKMTPIDSYDINLLEPFNSVNSSIVLPIMLIPGEEKAWASVNYVELINQNTLQPARSRWYFVESFEIENNGHMRLNLSLDVLTTYREEIKQQYAIIQSTENLCNEYLPGNYKTYQNTITEQITIGQPFNKLTYVLTVVGDTD